MIIKIKISIITESSSVVKTSVSKWKLSGSNKDTTKRLCPCGVSTFHLDPGVMLVLSRGYTSDFSFVAVISHDVSRSYSRHLIYPLLVINLKRLFAIFATSHALTHLED